MQRQNYNVLTRIHATTHTYDRGKYLHAIDFNRSLQTSLSMSGLATARSRQVAVGQGLDAASYQGHGFSSGTVPEPGCVPGCALSLVVVLSLSLLCPCSAAAVCLISHLPEYKWTRAGL